MLLSVFFSLVGLGVDLGIEEAKSEFYLLVFVIYTNTCKAHLVGYINFILSIVKYYEYIKDPFLFTYSIDMRLIVDNLEMNDSIKMKTTKSQ